MSNDLQSSEDVPDERLKIESLKKRLSKVNEVVELVGPLPSTTSETIDEILSDLDAVLQKQTETDEKSRLKLSDLNKLELSSEDSIDVALDERRTKHESLTKKIKTLEEQLKDYKKVLGDKADSKYEKEFTDAKRRTGECKNIDDDQKAILEIEAIDKIASDAISSMIQEVNVETRKQVGSKIENFTSTFTLPKYGGKWPFKSSTQKDFEKNVATPVATLLQRIIGSSKSGNLISDEDHDELDRLKKLLDRNTMYFSRQAVNIDKNTHPHTYKLYTDYENTCTTLSTQLNHIEKNAVPSDITAYRCKKREVDVALKELDKRIGVWKRIDSYTQGVHQDVADQKRDEYEKVLKQFEKDGDPVAGAKSLDDLLLAVKKVKDAVFGSLESNHSLNDEVKKLGKAPTKTKDVEFLKEALKARYNLERVDGDSKGACLVALYNAFALVPDSHTKHNQWLTELERDRNVNETESIYRKAGDKGKSPKKGGLIAIRAVRPGEALTWLRNELESTPVLKNSKDSKKVDKFSWITLHEIGHAVDHSDDFMARRQKDFGNWAEHPKADIRRMMTAEFCKEHSDAPWKFAEAYIKAVMDGKNPSDKPETINNNDESKKTTESAALSKWKEAVADLRGFLRKEPEELDLIEKEPEELDLNAIQQRFLDSLPLVKAIELLGEFESTGRPDQKTVENRYAGRVESWNTKSSPFNATAMGLGIRLLDKNETRSACDFVSDFLKEFGNPQTEEPDWETFKKSEILVWYKNAAFKEPKGFLDGIKLTTDGANWVRAGKMPRSDGRVYLEAYDGNWVSYDKKTWNERLTDYQMRSPKEYFAEAYAAFFLGKLPKSAPIYDALVKLQMKKELAN